jgi:transposase
MRKKGSHYSNDEKYHFIRLYHESGMSKRSFCKLHGISSASQLRYWLKKFTVPSEDVSLSSEVVSTMSNRSKEDYKDENAQLKKRIKELEKALAFSKLETEARDLMITRAEEYFNIPIRKKSGAK